MATTVEAKSRVEAPEPVAKPVWYRGRERLLLAALGALIAALVVGWFVMASARRKEQFAQRSLNQARSAAEAGNLPLASSELQRVITTYKTTKNHTRADTMETLIPCQT